jgi:flagellar basal-body rod protein FlgB
LLDETASLRHDRHEFVARGRVMALNWQAALGIHPLAWQLEGWRAEILASNMAHADTPHYLARDFDFRGELDKALGAQQDLQLALTDPRHLPKQDSMLAPDALPYRVPFSPALDGNTVDTNMERMAYLENALAYQTSLTFLNGKFHGLRVAIQGQ